MVHLLSTRAEMRHSDFLQECARGGLTGDYSRRLSPHSIRDLLEPSVMSSCKVLLNTEPMLKFKQSQGPLHIFQLCINWPDLTWPPRRVQSNMYTIYSKVMTMCYIKENLWLCRKISLNPLDDFWVSVVSSVDALFCRALPSNLLSQPFPLTVMACSTCVE